jgi:hypothetical protein
LYRKRGEGEKELCGEEGIEVFSQAGVGLVPSFILLDRLQKDYVHV